MHSCTPHGERGFGRHAHGFSEFLSALLRSRSDRRGFSDLSKRTFTDPLSAVIPYKNSMVYLYTSFCLFRRVYFANHGFILTDNGELDSCLRRSSICTVYLVGAVYFPPTALMPLSSSTKRAIGLLFAQHVTLVQTKYRI